MIIWIRTDASHIIGTGHVMRMLTLAGQLRKKGANVSFICREHPGHLIDWIEAKGFPVYRLSYTVDADRKKDENAVRDWLGTSLKEEIKQVKELMESHLKGEYIDWLIVDHYALDQEWEQTFRPYVKRILVVDDLANRPHDCDLLLDPNDYENAEQRYATLVPPHAVKLLGPTYALLREEFRTVRKKDRSKTRKIERILVFFGGSDPTNETEKVLLALQDITLPNLMLDVVVGRSNPHKDHIQKICQTLKNANYSCQIENMAERMAEADLFIGAGGSTTWERCYLGLPSVVIAVAENQVEATERLAKVGALIYLGWHEQVKKEDIRRAVNELIAHPERLKEMSQICQKVMADKIKHWDLLPDILMREEPC